MRNRHLMALAVGASVAFALAMPSSAQTPAQSSIHHAKKMHHSLRGHAAYARAPAPEAATQQCWIGSDKGAIDRGVYGYYG